MCAATWGHQVDGLSDRHVLAPDLPGHGVLAHVTFPGFAACADWVAGLVRRRAIGGCAHVVGLSMGGFIATALVRRHPDLVASCTISGSALCGYSRLDILPGMLSAPMWTHRWFWYLQSFAFMIPAEERAGFATMGAAASAKTNRRSIRRALTRLPELLPQTQTWVAPGMHHPWSAEDPELFTRMVRSMVDTGRWPQAEDGASATPRA